ncbi:hypothetical protein FRC09_016925 [Ceratobasidium sp. 395]|nr:hypothetical protein FRC09_016925 [Ceratobasidium sp. 395]
MNRNRDYGMGRIALNALWPGHRLDPSIIPPPSAELNMSSGDLVLKWVWPNPEDLRNSDLYSNRDSKEVKEFTFETLPGDMLFVTYFFRFNHHTGRFEEAGRVEWYPNSERHGTVYFGERQVNTESLSRRKKATSRFKSNKGNEYKWKKGSDVGLHELDFVCVDSWRRVVGKWIHASQTLTMTSGGFAIFDELVVTLFLQIWRREKGYW